ncbi:MAG: arylesterase [Chromatiaceae bacterium]|jgi:lysophospholipase L1-like esterase|nr:arylesterase [Chromatiaceae bacterium]
MAFRIALLILALALAACERTEPLRPLGLDAVVLAFGDSLTHGTGASAGASYPEVLAGLLDRSVINAGVPGEVSAEGRERLPVLLEEHQPSLVILLHGGNDLLRRKDQAETAENLRAMIEMARSAGAEVVLLGVPKPGLFLSAADFYGDLAGELRLPYDGDTIPEILGDASLKSDTVHPNAAGYRRLAESVHRLITGAAR